MTRIRGSTDSDLRITDLRAEAYTVPTDRPESDGTIAWTSTTIVIAEVKAGDVTGLGYAYASAAARMVILDVLRDLVMGRDITGIPAIYVAMSQATRNIGRPGIAASAVAAVDIALWDLKAKLFGVSLASLLGQARDDVLAYGSGGFTSYSLAELREQLAGWATDGIRAVKMKVGRESTRDAERVAAARAAVGPEVDLFVDANGAYTRSEALRLAGHFAEHHVSWFEEPVSSDDLTGLAALRERLPAGMRVAAGEYGYDAEYFRRMLAADSVDVLQADATRCGGVSGFLQAAALCDAFATPLSAHTAPSLHTHLCCTAPRAINVEYFHDHARIERLLFDGALFPVKGRLSPDQSRPGLGLELKRADAARYKV
jgi:L-alanine-DL-glutamate epimerase-like enolase superfamily enzyme